jgi:DNA-binding transcriptional LysR family regulator
VTLLERTTRKLKLTQEGQQFLVKARKILNELNAAEEELQKSDQGTAGLIRIDSATPFVVWPTSKVHLAEDWKFYHSSSNQSYFKT